MPIYEYHCSGCDKEVEVFFLSIADSETQAPECPDCGGTELKRLISSVSVVSEKPSQANTQTQKQSSNTEDTSSLANEMKKAESNSKKGYGDDFKEVRSRLEKGESSVSIEKKMRDRVGEKMGAH